MKHGMNPWTFAAFGLAACFAIAGCSGGGDCVSHAQSYCQENVLYWVDSCGNLEEMQQVCSNGCSVDHTACAGGVACNQDTDCTAGQRCVGGTCCAPVCTGKCCGSDGCGGTCPDTCASLGQVCNSASCVCQAGCQSATCQSLSYVCGDVGDGCGGTLHCGTCPSGYSCSYGQCEKDALTEGSACTCEAYNDGGTYGRICYGNGEHGCGLTTPALWCYAENNGQGHCYYNCTTAELGTQGSCPDGRLCGCSGLESITGDCFPGCSHP